MDKKTWYNNPSKVKFTKDEKAMGNFINYIKSQISEDDEKNKLIKKLDISKIKNDFIFLVWTPIEKAPKESLFMGTFNSWEIDLEILNYILSIWWVNTVKTDFLKLWKTLESWNENEKEFLTKWEYFISSLPPRWESLMYDNLDKFWINHINSNAFNKSSDLFYTTQILEKIWANQPETLFLETDFLFKNIESKSKLKKNINEKLIKSWFWEISKENPIFIRSWIASFKNLHKEDINKSENFNIIKNIFGIITQMTLDKIKKISFKSLLKWKQDNLTEEDIKKSIINNVESSWYSDILKNIDENKIDINKYKKWIKEMEELSNINEWNGMDRFKFDDINKLVDFLNKNLLLIISSGLLNESWIALRKFIDIEKFEKTDNAKFQVPLSKDYRCIINNGELMNVTTWTPYNAIDNFSNEILDELKLKSNEINIIKDIAIKFSKESWLKSYTLDVMKWKDWKLYFYEINRLEHSHMSHAKTRITLAYENACRLADNPPDKKQLQDFIWLFKHDNNFQEIFYWKFIKLLENNNVNWQLDDLIKLHKNTIEKEYQDFINFNVIWDKYNIK